jgi:hypothetical protein
MRQVSSESNPSCDAHADFVRKEYDNYSCGDDGPARSAAAIYDKVAAVTTPYPD